MASDINLDNLKGRKVLYIEDDANNRELVETALTAFGMKVEFDQWAFPEVATLKVMRIKPDIILLDLMFPMGISGYDVFDRLKQTQKIPNIPIVIVSAADANTEIPIAREKGLTGYIAKPVNVMTLPTQISQILNGESIWISQ